MAALTITVFISPKTNMKHAQIAEVFGTSFIMHWWRKKDKITSSLLIGKNVFFVIVYT